MGISQTLAKINQLKRLKEDLQKRRKQRRAIALNSLPKLYPLHPGQEIVHNDPARFRIVVCGRRWGKSRLALYEGIVAAFTGNYPVDPASPPVVVFALPTLKQAKKIFWKPLVNLLEGHPLVESVNRSDYVIRLKGGRPDVICLGLNDQDGDRARGLRIAFACLDEFQDIKPSIFEEILRPALADTPGSRVLITGTPKGKSNHLYLVDQKANTQNDYSSYHFRTIDNPYIDPGEVAEARATQDPRVFRQEWEASYEDFPGQIYEHLSLSVLGDPPNVFRRVVLGVDWGDINPAIAVVGETNEGVWWVLDDWYSSTGVTVLPSEHLKAGQDLVKKYGAKRAYCGHDRPASIEIWNSKLGCRAESAFTGVSEGIGVVAGLIFHGKLRIDKRLKNFYDELVSYHRKQDQSGNFLDAPAPNQVDHRCDALRYALASVLLKPSKGAYSLKL